MGIDKNPKRIIWISPGRTLIILNYPNFECIMIISSLKTLQTKKY